MSKRPLAVIAVFFILGVLSARFLPYEIGFVHVLIAALIFILSSFVFSRYQKVSNLLLLLSVSLFAVFLYINSNTFSDSHITKFLEEEKLKTNIIGVIKSPALTRKPYYGKISSTYLFQLEAIKGQGTRDKGQGEEWVEVTGLAQIRIETEKDYRYGDRLLVKGTIRNPKSKNQNPKQPSNTKFQKSRFNYGEYLEMQNIFALINAKEAKITILSRNYKVNPVLKYTYLLREKLNDRILEKMPLESGALLRSVLLGDRSELPEDIQAAFKNSGTMHILAVSGLHVGIITLFIMYTLRFLRIERSLSYILTILSIVFFSLLTLSRPSVVRAVVMASIFLGGLVLGRKADPYNSLGAAAIFILLINPKDFFNVGFQLSFAAVLSILYFTPRLIKLINPDTNLYIRKYLYMPLFVSMSASLGTSPFILYYFKIITPIAVVANMVVIPALSILLIGGLAFFLLGWVPFLGAFLAGFNNVAAYVIFNAADFFSSIEFGHFYL